MCASRNVLFSKDDHFHVSSQVQTTLAVVEEERDRFMTKLLNEEKSRKALEGTLVSGKKKTTFIAQFSVVVLYQIPCFATEQHRELEHAIGAMKSEKSHLENQFKVLQQKNEIMIEMYQQKENALQQ